MKLYLYFILWITVSTIVVKTILQTKVELKTSNQFVLRATNIFSSLERKMLIPVHSNTSEDDFGDEKEIDDSELFDLHVDQNLNRRLNYISSIHSYYHPPLRWSKPYLKSHFTPPECI